MLLWTASFTLVPLCVLCFFSVTNKNGGFTLTNFLKILDYQHIILRSIVYATLTTTFCLFVAYPFAYFIFKNLKQASQKFLIVLIILPTLLSMLLRTFAWMTLLEKNGLINKVLKLINLPPLKLINTPGAIILVMIYDFLPFMILPIYGSIRQINSNIIDASQDLGANELQTFRKVILPMSLKGVFQGIELVFVLSCSTFIVPRLMSGGTTILIGDLIESKFMGTTYNPWLGSALALGLNVIIIIIVALTGKLGADKKGVEKNEPKIFI